MSPDTPRTHQRYQLLHLPVLVKQSSIYRELYTNRVTLTVGLDALAIPTVTIASDGNIYPTRELTEQRFAVLQLLANLTFDADVAPEGLENFIERNHTDTLGLFLP